MVGLALLLAIPTSIVAGATAYACGGDARTVAITIAGSFIGVVIGSIILEAAFGVAAFYGENIVVTTVTGAAVGGSTAALCKIFL